MPLRATWRRAMSDDLGTEVPEKTGQQEVEGGPSQGNHDPASNTAGLAYLDAIRYHPDIPNPPSEPE